MVVMITKMTVMETKIVLRTRIKICVGIQHGFPKAVVYFDHVI